jgi:uncharacterized membrane protein YvbJ
MSGSFFCEACGAEVKSGASSCPSCGRRFLGVRCPECGREGRPAEFAKGCPDCGYMAGSEGKAFSAVPGRRKRPPRKDWPASRYWSLSILLIFALAAILFFWLRG